MSILAKDFYLRGDVVEIAKDLLGKLLITRFDGQITSGIVTETEAYAGVTDRASHAYGGRRTGRTEIMYREGGTAYIYLCYGVHSLFNIVTNRKDIPHAVLIRGIKPVDGILTMEKRTGRNHVEKGFTDGPGKVSKAMGIHYSCSGMTLLINHQRNNGSGIWVEDNGHLADPRRIDITPRIGIDYSGEDAKLPYRFVFRA